MLKADLYRIGKYAMELYQMMDEFEGKGEVDFPHWWQSKIINAKSNLVGAKHYLDFEVKEPAIDAVVDRISDVAPEMEIDGVNEAARTYWHVIEDVDQEKGWQGFYKVFIILKKKPKNELIAYKICFLDHFSTLKHLIVKKNQLILL
jgi:hypothetical protein